MGPFIYFVSTFLDFLVPTPTLRKHVFSSENKQRMPFSNPASAYVIYKWSLSNAFGATDMVDVEDLYCEVIYCLLHMIGNDSPKVS